MTLIKLAAFLLALLPLFPADLLAAAGFAGAVTSVQDGDTLTVLHQNQIVRVRLSGIDCPEKNQPFGAEARSFTADLALGQTATVIGEKMDRYGRVVATVILAGGRNLNYAIVAVGLAWWYREFAPGNVKLAELEADARDQRRGLWAAAGQLPPWEWRKQSHRPARADQRRSDRRSEPRSEPRSRRRDTGRSAR